MASKCKRLTFVVTPEMELLLDEMKRDMFYNRSQSEMIRTLVGEGLRVVEEEKQRNQTEQPV